MEQHFLNPRSLQIYADAIHGNGGTLPPNCFGFIEGTVRPICRPKKLQRTVYNGHKRVHALKFQWVTLPNGLTAHLYGPLGKKICIFTEAIFYSPNFPINVFSITVKKTTL